MALDFVGVAKRDAAGARGQKVSVRFVECGGRPKVCVLAGIHIKDSDVVEAAVACGESGKTKVVCAAVSPASDGVERFGGNVVGCSCKGA